MKTVTLIRSINQYQTVLPEQLHHLHLPKEITLAFESQPANISGNQIDFSEGISGSLLLKKMAAEFLDIPSLDVLTEKYEKPKVYSGNAELSASFSHTASALTAGISKEMNIGVDMELCNRIVTDRLKSRMKHEGELTSLYEKIDSIRIWTLKEAALKQIGTGLRKPMKSVKINVIDYDLFSVEFDDGKQAKICSFKHQEHWISICYQKLP